MKNLLLGLSLLTSLSSFAAVKTPEEILNNIKEIEISLRTKVCGQSLSDVGLGEVYTLVSNASQKIVNREVALMIVLSKDFTEEETDELVDSEVFTKSSETLLADMERLSNDESQDSLNILCDHLGAVQ